MNINEGTFNLKYIEQTKTDLQTLIDQPSDKQKRPCPGCKIPCPHSHSITSTEMCSPGCPNAPLEMSSDPENFPIESHIVPLVYSLNTMRTMTPCWSCEGHQNAGGYLYKIPRVWFYSTSNFYPKLLAEFTNQLHGMHRLKNPWHVVVLPYSQSTFSTAYSLEPYFEDIESKNRLALLWQDIDILSEGMRKGLFDLARMYLQSSGNKKAKTKKITADDSLITLALFNR